MRVFYSFLMYLLSPVLLLRLLWKSRQLPAYRQRISERFCIGMQGAKPCDVWLHAVSLGEVIAAKPLIEAMLAKKWSVLVTTMTPTGSERVLAHFGDRVAHQYLPYDLPGVLSRFLSQRQPRAAVIMETELWPNLIHKTQAAKVPLFLANARLSPHSFRGYKRLRFLFKPLLNAFYAVLPQSQDDANRFLALGTRPDLVHMLGNMKFDLQTANVNSAQLNGLKQLWGEKRVTVIAASTHDKEEALILAELPRLQQAIPGLILLIAPRHPERFQTVYQLCQEAGLHTGLRSDASTLSEENEVVVLDSLGELLGLYQLSDYAFVGGSLVPVGGHNVLEPIAMQVPVLSGSEVFNFKTICADLAAAQAIILVNKADELIDAIISLHQNTVLRDSMRAKATEVLESNKGAVGRHIQHIEAVLR